MNKEVGFFFGGAAFGEAFAWKLVSDDDDDDDGAERPPKSDDHCPTRTRTNFLRRR